MLRICDIILHFFLESENSLSDKILLVLLGILLGIIFAAAGYIFKRVFQRFHFFICPVKK